MKTSLYGKSGTSTRADAYATSIYQDGHKLGQQRNLLAFFCGTSPIGQIKVVAESVGKLKHLEA